MTEGAIHFLKTRYLPCNAIPLWERGGESKQGERESEQIDWSGAFASRLAPTGQTANRYNNEIG
jgi:hypothetical protein